MQGQNLPEDVNKLHALLPLALRVSQVCQQLAGMVALVAH